MSQHIFRKPLGSTPGSTSFVWRHWLAAALKRAVRGDVPTNKSLRWALYQVTKLILRHRQYYWPPPPYGVDEGIPSNVTGIQKVRSSDRR